MTIYEYREKNYLSKPFIPRREEPKVIKKTISDKGTVYSVTTKYIPPTEFAKDCPYPIAIIQLKDVPIKVTARMEEPVKIGDTVYFTKFEKGTYHFRKQRVFK
ncbi:OB-fold domain-containing protein [Rummeliibacillus sp. JY-2-4R]